MSTPLKQNEAIGFTYTVTMEQMQRHASPLSLARPTIKSAVISQTGGLRAGD